MPLIEVQAWIGEVSGSESLQQLNTAWANFASHEQPVVTLFGAYDTGKSSIVRRLLVESGLPIPEWLTISARHETFAGNLVEVAGCVVRDTPGLSPEGADVRSLNNSAVARSALGLTDVLLVTLNPQLATGERLELLEVISEWRPQSCIWYLISRADEGGVDPTRDQVGFQEWAERKRAELRASLSLDGTGQIHVLVPDYAGLGAFEPEPDASVWDISRPWDGMAELRLALEALPGQDLNEARTAAERRFWRGAISERLDALQERLDDLMVSRDVTSNALKARDLFLKQLEELNTAGKVSLEGTVQDAIRRAQLNPQVDAESIQKAVDPVLEQWWREQQAGLARIRTDAIKAFDQQREGRGWAKLEALYSTFAQPDPADAGEGRRFTPRFEKLGEKAFAALKNADDVRKKGTKRSADAARTGAEATANTTKARDWGQLAGVGAAVLPFVVELAAMVEDEAQKRSEQARDRERRQLIAEEVARVVKAAADHAMKALAPDAEALSREISEQSVGQAEVDELEAAVAAATTLVSRGQALLSS